MKQESGKLLDSEAIYQCLAKHQKTHYFINRGCKNITYKAPMDRIGVSYAFNIDKFASGYYNYSSYPFPETPLGDKICYYIKEFAWWVKDISHCICVGLFMLSYLVCPLVMLVIFIIRLIQGN